MFRLPQPRARDMLDAGVIVALGSDFNPNAYCCSMVSNNRRGVEKQMSVAWWFQLILYSLSHPPSSANSHAPGLRQHEDVHAGGFGCGHHQRGLRPQALRHTRLPGGQQTRRPAGPQHHTVNQDTHTQKSSGSKTPYLYYEIIIVTFLCLSQLHLKRTGRDQIKISEKCSDICTLLKHSHFMLLYTHFRQFVTFQIENVHTCDYLIKYVVKLASWPTSTVKRLHINELVIMIQ